MRRGILGLLLTTILLFPAPAAADWLLSPYVGLRFAGDSQLFLDLDRGADDKKFIWGVAAGLLSDGILGLEIDFSYLPGFFESGGEDALTAQSRGLTLMGNVIVAIPAGATGYGLRPYVSGGAGWLHASARNIPPGDVLLIDFDSVGMNLGAGAIGPISPRSNVRFDIRHFRSTTTDDDEPVNALGTQLSFWRATVGLTFRFPS